MDWNELYQRGETPWEKGVATPVLAEVQARHPEVFANGTRVLVPGCGVGHDARWIAGHGDCEVTGLDIAPLAIDQARAQAGPAAGSVTYQVQDLFALPAEFGQAFEVVWEHTCLCALDPAMRESYVRVVRSCLRDGGMVAGVFFINPEMGPGETGPPFGISVEKLEALWTGAGFGVLDSWVPAAAYPGREGRERAMILRLL